MPQDTSSRSSFFKGLLVIVCAVGIFLLLFRSHQPPAGRAIGTPLPPIQAVGWLNGAAPTSAELANKVLVIDVWASWCGPCRQQAPEMVLLHEKYHSQGVEFIGLSPQSAEDIDDMQAFLKHTGISWKNGYGAEETLRALGADYLPMIWVVNRHNQIVWNQASSISLEQGIRQAVAAQ